MKTYRDELDKLFSSSLTEFILIIAFMFVLISVSFKVQRDAAMKLVNTTDQQVYDLVELSDQLKRLERKLGIEGAEEVSLADRLEHIRVSLPDGMSIEDDWDTLYKIKGYLDVNGDVASQLIEIQDKITKLNSLNKHLLSRSGLDKQPCEIASSGKLVYLASVDLHDKFAVFYKISNHALNSKIPPKHRVSYKEFEDLSEYYFNWSNEKVNDCRFFVKIQDFSTTKDHYKSAMMIVERYFYKYESRS